MSMVNRVFQKSCAGVLLFFQGTNYTAGDSSCLLRQFSGFPDPPSALRVYRWRVAGRREGGVGSLNAWPGRFSIVRNWWSLCLYCLTGLLVGMGAEVPAGGPLKLSSKLN
ncbi:hypothetical protein GDO81_000415 [Engystomops pustulosus]|uniref:Uncharacterized protein n=1 Tax=Engystomops pustulosus TaxID=76066 RepID=A0AAV7D783_ENGPU|nr:hypothetical protein GDO81_000415 [Engystomops pustulosus]